ncbi:MAG: hypothetical protein IJV69_01465, partial [Kiritimatiellae bacterium]|nr:hypothetical protein [Kiritimatiellia bacterium]
ITIVMMMWLFLSPVFIPFTLVKEKLTEAGALHLLKIYELNPMTNILCTWRDIFHEPGFHPERFLYMAIISTLVFFIGRWIFQKLEPRFAEMM